MRDESDLSDESHLSSSFSMRKAKLRYRDITTRRRVAYLTQHKLIFAYIKLMKANEKVVNYDMISSAVVVY